MTMIPALLLLSGSCHALGCNAAPANAPWGTLKLASRTDRALLAIELALACAALRDCLTASRLAESAVSELSALAWLCCVLSCLLPLVRGEDFVTSGINPRRLAYLVMGPWSLRVLYAVMVFRGIGSQDGDETWNRAASSRSPEDDETISTKSSPGDGLRRKLKVLVLTIGTRGDVQPFVTFGQEMQRRGHSVTICAFGKHRELVERYGLTFAYAGVEEIEQDNATWRSATHVSEVMALSLPDFRDNYLIVGRAFYAAALDCGADVVVATSTTQSFAFSIGEKIARPVWVVKLAPDNPTRLFAPQNYVRYSPHSALGMGGVLNYLKWLHHWFLVARAANRAGMGASEDLFRREVLGLERLSNGKRLGEMGSAPTLGAFSRVVVGTPRDWPGNVRMTGWWFSSGASACRSGSLLPNNGNDSSLVVSPESLAVVQFLGVGGSAAPSLTVCITFGSMSPAAEACNLFELGVEAVRRVAARRRAAPLVRILVVRPRGGGSTRALLFPNSPDVMEVEEAPYHTVFPLCTCVVHHGGAGTLASVVEAGVPSVVVPVLTWTDQPLWGALVEEAGLGALVLQPFAQLNKCSRDDGGEDLKLLERARADFLTRLESGLRRCVDDVSREKLATAARSVVSERGAVEAADLMERGLGVL